MDFDLNPNSVGFKDMDPLQIKAFMDFVEMSIECAIKHCDSYASHVALEL